MVFLFLTNGHGKWSDCCLCLWTEASFTLPTFSHLHLPLWSTWVMVRQMFLFLPCWFFSFPISSTAPSHNSRDRCEATMASSSRGLWKPSWPQISSSISLFHVLFSHYTSLSRAWLELSQGIFEAIESCCFPSSVRWSCVYRKTWFLCITFVSCYFADSVYQL